jgi:hypothetical protein
MGGRLHKVWIMTDTRDNKQKKDAGQRQRSRRQQRTTMRERATASEKSAAVTSARMTAVAMVPDLDLGRGTMVAREQLARRLMRLAAEAKETWRGCAWRAFPHTKTRHNEPGCAQGAADVAGGERVGRRRHPARVAGAATAIGCGRICGGNLRHERRAGW